VRILAVVGGLSSVAGVMSSAIQTVILPRGAPSRIARVVFGFTRLLFQLRIRRRAPYHTRDRILALYAPVSLIMLLISWLGLTLLAFTAVFWGLHAPSLRDAFVESGSSLLTLGFARAPDLPATSMSFLEAGLGLILLAMLITYLPSMYAAFARREQLVAMMEVRAGSPPSAVEMFLRYHGIGWMDRLPDMWRRWEQWFVDIDESHVSFPALSFFRSSQPGHSWVTAAGAVLDAAALSASTIDHAPDPDAELCIRAGFLTLRRIAGFFGIPYDPDPRPDDPISIRREEFDAVCEQLEAGGVPVRTDREKAWRDFAGWRVNYDKVLLGLAAITMAPWAPWSTDRVDMVVDELPLARWQKERIVHSTRR